jgi:hypothetical protein
MLKRKTTLAFLAVTLILLAGSLIFAAYRSSDESPGRRQRGSQMSIVVPVPEAAFNFPP